MASGRSMCPRLLAMSSSSRIAPTTVPGARTVNPSGAGRKNPDPLAPRPNAAANRTAVMPCRCR